MGNVTYTKQTDKLFSIGGNQRMAIGSIQMSNSYATGGDAFDPTSNSIIGLTTILACLLEQPSGYILEFINSTKTIKAYYPSGSPTLSGEATHTHAVALDGGASAAEAAHTHAVALDGGVSDAEAAHTHAVALDGGASAAEAAHTHAVALDGGVSGAGDSHNHVFTGSALATHQHDAITAGTPAGTVAAPVFTGSALATHQHDAITAGTPAGTNATSVVTPRYQSDLRMVTKPVIALTHNANPAVNLLANPLYIVEAYGESTQNVGVLQSNNNGAANILGETANGTVGGIAASCRFFVLHNATPAGVQIYIDEAAGDRLEFVSPTTTNGWLIMTIEAAAGAPPGFACAIKVYHDATAATGKALSFDDNGVADAQLCFIDAGGVGGVIPAADIVPIAPTYIGPAADALGIARAAAQVFSGSALGTHQHAVVSAGTPAGTNSAPIFTGSALGTHQHAVISAGTPAGTNAAEATHTHGPGTLADVASGVGSSHTHGPGTLADAASAAGSSHTHGPGTLADVASGVGSSHTHGPGTLVDAASAAGLSHTHTATAEVAEQVGAGVDLSGITGVRIVVIGV